MAVRSHPIEHRCSVPWTLIAALIHLDQKRFRFSIPLCRPFVPGMAFGRKRSCVLTSEDQIAAVFKILADIVKE
jgi:hypothetical protein